MLLTFQAVLITQFLIRHSLYQSVMAELSRVLREHLRLYRLQSSLLFLLPSFPCSMHKESKPEAQTWTMGWGGNRGKKVTLKKKQTAEISHFLCVFPLSNFLRFSS